MPTTTPTQTPDCGQPAAQRHDYATLGEQITRTEQTIDGLDAIVWTLTIDGEQVAHLDAHRSGLILNVEVETGYRGEGHARTLFTRADAEHGLYHVPAWGRTHDGHGFADAVGGDVMDDQQAADILGLDLDVVTGDMD